MSFSLVAPSLRPFVSIPSLLAMTVPGPVGCTDK